MQLADNETALADALPLLGYEKIYHMREVGKNEHQNQWIELIEAKFGENKRPIRREEFEAILKDYDVGQSRTIQHHELGSRANPK